MDSFVLAVGTKKTLQRMQKEYEDLVCYSVGLNQLVAMESTKNLASVYLGPQF